ncbi:helix-turn-helix domain-containing protein [Oerskovia enterophila]
MHPGTAWCCTTHRRTCGRYGTPSRAPETATESRAIPSTGCARARRAIVTRAETAGILDVDKRTLDKALDAGEIPHLRVGRRIVVPCEKLLALLTNDPSGQAAA